MPSRNGLTDTQKIAAYLAYKIKQHPSYRDAMGEVEIYAPLRGTDHFDVLITPQNRTTHHNLVLLVEDTVNELLPPLLRSAGEPLDTGKIFSKKPMQLLVKANGKETAAAGVEFGEQGSVMITRHVGDEKELLPHCDGVYARIHMTLPPAIALQRIRECDAGGLDQALSNLQYTLN